MRPFSSKRTASIAVVAFVALSSLGAMGSMAADGLSYSQLGHFSFAYGSGSDSLYNISFTNGNYSIILADSVVVKGEHGQNPFSGQYYVNRTVQLANVTVGSTDDQDMLLLGVENSTSALSPSVEMHLPSPAVVAQTGPQHNKPGSSGGGGVLSQFLANPVYQMPVPGGFIYYMSNSPSTLTSNGMAVLFQGSSSTDPGTLVVGITPGASIKYSTQMQLNNYSYLNIDPFSFNQSTGSAYGSYVSLHFNAASGVIGDYAGLATGTRIFSSIYSYGNGSIGGSPVDPTFPSGNPMIVGNMLYYANRTAVYEIQNSPSTMGSFFVSNGTLVMEVSGALSVDPMGNAFGGMPSRGSNAYMQGKATTGYSDFGHASQYVVQSSSRSLLISGGSYMGELMVSNGAVKVSGNTVSISSSGIAHATYVSQPWMMHVANATRNSLRYAEMHGNMGGMLSVGSADPAISNLTTIYNPEMQMSVQEISAGRVTIQLGSSTPDGSSFAVFIPNSVLNNGTPVKFVYDGNTLSPASGVDAVLNGTTQGTSSYYCTAVENGSLYIIHVSHFSTHSISISRSTTPWYSNGWLYTAIIIAAALGLLLSGFAYTRRISPGKKK